MWDDVSLALLIQFKCLAKMMYCLALILFHEETMAYLWEWSFIAEIYSLTQKLKKKKGEGGKVSWSLCLFVFTLELSELI